jgi:hypothetical protein
MNLNDIIQWFTDLKNQGVTREQILDVLEFDSDFYPDMAMLYQARKIVFGEPK